MKEAPTKWTTIAITSPSSGKLEQAPGAFIAHEGVALRDDIETRYTMIGQRWVMQARKKGGR